MSHTPGPWHTEDNKTGGYSVYNFEDRPIASWIAKTDARLIAAAPELLEALKAARPIVRGRHSTLTYGPKALLDQIDAAIAKAEGHDHDDGNKLGRTKGEIDAG